MTKYYLLGETHGTHECPSVCLAILRKHKIKNLALEFDKDYQPEIDQYVRGKRSLESLSIFQTPPVHDGRSSSAMKHLVEMAKKEGISLFLVDDYSDPSLRDRHMADNLRKIHGKVLYLCGNIHASKLLIPIPPFFRLLNSILSLIGKGMILPPGNLQPCGSYLPKKETDSYKIVALNGGDYYNLRKKSMRPDQELRARDSPLPTVINGEGGYDHLYVVDRFTYSR